MNLNRPLIKHQAKGLISGNVFKLFVIQLVVFICMMGIWEIGATGYMRSVFRYIVPFVQSIEDNSADFDDFGIDDDFNNFGNGSGNDFYNFGADENVQGEPGSDFYNFGAGNDADYYADSDYYEDFFFNFASLMAVFWLVYTIGFIVYILLSPLEVSLSGLYVSFARGNRFDTGSGIKTVFRNAFKNHYGKKLGLVVLRGICIYFLSWLFIIPGIVYLYSTYFANQIMCDNPDISPSQALDVSKKMVKGNRWELFVLNLSFIPWLLLCGIGFGIPYIYVWPYMATTNALYYENFRLRALQEGRVTEDDFLSDAQRYAKYAQMYGNGFNPQNAPYGNVNAQNPYYANQNTQYNPNVNPNAQYAPYGNQNTQYQPYGNVNQQYNPYAAPYQQPYNPQGNVYYSAPPQNTAPPYANAASMQPQAPVQAQTAADAETMPQEAAPIQETAPLQQETAAQMEDMPVAEAVREAPVQTEEMPKPEVSSVEETADNESASDVQTEQNTSAEDE